ncbi:MAG: hypothetical protein ACYTDV_03420 [Planctomycetota bacterium]|jgi:hypothetical protein
MVRLEFYPTEVRVDHWYHAKVRNFVKEVAIMNYQGDSSSRERAF